MPGRPELQVTASIGIAELADGRTGEELLRHADMAMYDAKAAGRHQIARYTAGPRRRSPGNR